MNADFKGTHYGAFTIICILMVYILEIKLKVAYSILMKDLADFEKYLAKRFNFKDIDIKISLYYHIL